MLDQGFPSTIYIELPQLKTLKFVMDLADFRQITTKLKIPKCVVILSARITLNLLVQITWRDFACLYDTLGTKVIQLNLRHWTNLEDISIHVNYFSVDELIDLMLNEVIGKLNSEWKLIHNDNIEIVYTVSWKLNSNVFLFFFILFTSKMF